VLAVVSILKHISDGIAAGFSMAYKLVSDPTVTVLNPCAYYSFVLDVQSILINLLYGIRTPMRNIIIDENG
jgi:hypothetical protein